MSVRRSRPITARSHEDELPEHLRVPCWCEDWLDPDEQPRQWATVDTPEDLAFHLSLIARRRWKAARLEWAEERGMTWREFSGSYAHGRPRWRDWPTYLATRRH